MLWELSVAEQRYRAVLEVGIGVPVTEVAERYGVSRQSVHTWLVRYRQEGVAGLEDRSHQGAGCKPSWSTPANGVPGSSSPPRSSTGSRSSTTGRGATAALA